MQTLSNYVHRPQEDGKRRYYVIPEPEAHRILASQDSLLYTRFFQDTDSIIGHIATEIPIRIGAHRNRLRQYFTGRTYFYVIKNL